MKLLIVESPNKISKIRSFLPPDWNVDASIGHIRDLPLKELGIDRQNGYALTYLVDSSKEEKVATLQAKARQVGAENVYIGTDPDREGESIAFHLCQVLNLDPYRTKRVTFQEITQQAITTAVASPRTVDMELVAAQESRRAVDRLVGYEISVLLQRKFGKTTPGYSAGRVQSVATKLVVEREREISAFEGRLSFAISAEFTTSEQEKLTARWVGKAPETEAQARQVLNSVIGAGEYFVLNIERKPVTQGPPAPYSTSTLQQDGVKKLKLSVAQVTDLAQKLFEQGHITYIRTDSVNLSDQAKLEAQAQIQTQYGAEFACPRSFKEKAGSQGAHEAIRPTHWDQTVAGETADQKALYQLIYTRTLASQMSEARYDQTSITLAPGGDVHEGLLFLSSARVLTFEGYRKAYQEAAEEIDEDAATDNEEEGLLTKPISEGEPLQLNRMQANGRSQKPPRRYDEATLVAELEKRQIGRPSTYASTIATILKREYVAVGNVTGKKVKTKTLTWAGSGIEEQPRTETLGGDKGKLLPTERGVNATNYLQEFFPDIISYEFTADCENHFDLIAEGKSTYGDMVPVFDRGLMKQKTTAEITLPPRQAPHQVGEWAGKPITSGTGKFGGWVKYDEAFYNLAEGVDPLKVTVEDAINAIETGRETQRREVGRWEKKPIIAGISKMQKLYLLWNDTYYDLPLGTKLGTLSPEQAVEYLQIGISSKKALIFKQIDKKWVIKRGANGLYLSDGKDTATMSNITEEDAQKWDKAIAESHMKKIKAWKLKRDNAKK